MKKHRRAHCRCNTIQRFHPAYNDVLTLKKRVAENGKGIQIGDRHYHRWQHDVEQVWRVYQAGDPANKPDNAES